MNILYAAAAISIVVFVSMSAADRVVGWNSPYLTINPLHH